MQVSVLAAVFFVAGRTVEDLGHAGALRNPLQDVKKLFHDRSLRLRNPPVRWMIAARSHPGRDLHVLRLRPYLLELGERSVQRRRARGSDRRGRRRQNYLAPFFLAVPKRAGA
jgi:hypothetical protein